MLHNGQVGYKFGDTSNDSDGSHARHFKHDMPAKVRRLRDLQ